jgi:hypothetical protein
MPLGKVSSKDRSRTRQAPGSSGVPTSQQMYLALAFYVLTAMEYVRQIHVGAAPHEPPWHNSDHGADLAVEDEFASYHAGISVELALPELVPEKRDGLRARLDIPRPGQQT